MYQSYPQSLITANQFALFCTSQPNHLSGDFPFKRHDIFTEIWSWETEKSEEIKSFLNMH